MKTKEMVVCLQLRRITFISDNGQSASVMARVLKADTHRTRESGCFPVLRMLMEFVRRSINSL
eukprot:17265_1